MHLHTGLSKFKNQKRSFFLTLQFLTLPSITVGNHDYEKEGDVYTPLTICQQFYHNGSISPANESFDIDAQVDEGDVRVSWWDNAQKDLYFAVKPHQSCTFDLIFCWFLSECSLIYPIHPFSALTADPLNFTLHFERYLL